MKELGQTFNAFNCFMFSNFQYIPTACHQFHSVVGYGDSSMNKTEGEKNELNDGRCLIIEIAIKSIKKMSWLFQFYIEFI